MIFAFIVLLGSIVAAISTAFWAMVPFGAVRPYSDTNKPNNTFFQLNCIKPWDIVE